MHPSQRSGRLQVDASRRWSTSCLEDAAFRRAYHALLIDGSVNTALGQREARPQFFPWVHRQQPPPSSPQDVMKSPIPLHSLSRGPYGSNWRTLLQPTSRPPPELPDSLEADPEGGSNGQPQRPPSPKKNKKRRRRNKRWDKIDPLAAARNAEILRRRRSRTFCGPHAWIRDGDGGEASTAQFGTSPPTASVFGHIEFLSLNDAVDNTPNANGGGQSNMAKEEADSSSDEQDDDDEEEEKEEDEGSDGDDCEDVLEVLDGYDHLEDFEDEELQASWDPFWPEHRNGARRLGNLPGSR
ncbi:hypothetical protein F5B22DRAFT_17733 [Xylaria bambusicola]|uniref:uncharacterized protein n=1 Tax=Xylaria bambusicola TaxID=326684 RepID=UPI00200849ED|nr:uncharacterized protein F5B22DRAFT_17733 [Xylaria bambusicola]KAI0528062.1 hypothetical protein F5B22DRAFT_17733 [Xylaria bambusicola]